MSKYRLTTKGKLVFAVLCTFMLLFIYMGISLNSKNAQKQYDYKAPKSDSQQQVTIQEPPPAKAEKEEPWDQLEAAVYFEADMTSFDAGYHEALDLLSDTALKYESIKIQIEGNCATLFPANQKQKTINNNLSLLRAQAVANYFKSKGIEAARLIIVANGSDKPLKDNTSPEGRKFNRRVDVFFVNK